MPPRQGSSTKRLNKHQQDTEQHQIDKKVGAGGLFLRSRWSSADERLIAVVVELVGVGFERLRAGFFGVTKPGLH